MSLTLQVGQLACDGQLVPSLREPLGDASGVVQPPEGVTFRFDCKDIQVRGLAEKKLRRLTTPEIRNTLEALLGAEIAGSNEVTAQLGLMSSDTLTESVKELGEFHAPTHVSAMLNIATSAGELAFANPSMRDRLFGSCAGLVPVSDACAKAFIESFGGKAYRRPLETTEKDTLFSQFKSTGGEEGLKRTLLRILMAPPLTFHLELAGRREGNRMRLTDYEVASRISYRVASSLPDDALFSAASKGELQSLETVTQHVRRLYTSNALARRRVADFFKLYLSLNRTVTPIKLPQRNIDVVGLGEEMRVELDDFIEHVLFTKEGTFEELMTSREVFPRSQRMASILETTLAQGEAPSTTTSAHQGLVLRPALLLTGGQRTTPPHRGALIRQKLLCATLGMPDPDAVNGRADELGDLSALPNRTRFEKLTDAPQCSGRHALINPIGFALEGYDQLGMVRTTEHVLDANAQVIAQHPVDTRVRDSLLKNASGGSDFSDAAELVQAMGRSDEGRACFAQSVFEFQRLRVMEREDSCGIRDAEYQATYEGSALETFVAGVANDGIFWRAL